MSTIVIGLMTATAALGFFFYKKYHTLTQTLDIIYYNRDQINVLLDIRFQTFEALILAIHQFMDYERSTLKEVMMLRARAETALSTGDEKKRFAAEQEISKIAKNLPHVFEQYPELKSGKNVLQLQEEIANNETKLAYATQIYNENLLQFMVKKSGLIESVLTMIFPTVFNVNYPHWA